nr:MAG TPA: hypothetical protein [Caudoviricetes sp.]
MCARSCRSSTTDPHTWSASTSTRASADRASEPPRSARSSETSMHCTPRRTTRTRQDCTRGSERRSSERTSTRPHPLSACTTSTRGSECTPSSSEGDGFKPMSKNHRYTR